MLTALVRRANDWVKPRLKEVGITCLVGLLVHASLYVYASTNPDGLWSGAGFEPFFARPWDYSLGRWGWWVATTVKGGVSNPLFVTLITILLFSLGIQFCLDVININNKILRVLCGCFVICSPLVACSITYYPFSDIYGYAFLGSAMSVWFFCCARLPHHLNYVFGILSLVLAVGMYQTTVGVPLVLLACRFVFDAYDQSMPLKQAFLRLTKALLGVLVSCVLYLVVMKAVQFFTGVGMADYRGSGSISLSHAVASLGTSVPRTYTNYFDLIFGSSIVGNHFLAKWFNAALLVLSISSISVLLVRRRKSLVRCLCIAIATLLAPMAAGAIGIIVPDSGRLMPLMVGGYLVLQVCQIAIVSKAVESVQWRGALIGGLSALVALLTWSSVLQVNTDAAAMKLTMNQASTIAQDISIRLGQNEAYLQGAPVMIVGSPWDGSFKTPYNQSRCSPYVNWGLFWNTWDGSSGCWRTLLKLHSGVSLKMPSLDEMRSIASTPEFTNMPLFPARDSVGVVHDVLVVKMTDTKALH